MTRRPVPPVQSGKAAALGAVLAAIVGAQRSGLEACEDCGGNWRQPPAGHPLHTDLEEQP